MWDVRVRKRTVFIGAGDESPHFGDERPSKKQERKSPMIRRIKSGEYRLYSRKINPKTGKRRNLGTFPTLEQAKQHEREVQFFKRRAAG